MDELENFCYYYAKVLQYFDNIKDWVKAGVVAVSAGSSLTAGAKKGDFALVTETAKKFIAEYKAAKASK